MNKSLSVFQTGIKQQLGLETPNVDTWQLTKSVSSKKLGCNSQ